MIIPEYIKQPQHPITVNVIGIGGTGSLILPRLARMDYGLKLLGHPGLMVFSYDPDIVEEFNVGRQNFTDMDLGMNKAICITEKCNLAFGLLWKAFSRKFNLESSLKHDSFSNINIICVDNVEFRNEFYCEQFLMKGRHPYQSCFFNIDCGNGKDFGQVIISSPIASLGLKNPFQLFPDMINQDNEETQGIEGCSYEESLKKQDMFINDKIAVECVELIWKLFRQKTLDVNGVIVNSQKSKTLPIKIE